MPSWWPTAADLASYIQKEIVDEEGFDLTGSADEAVLLAKGAVCGFTHQLLELVADDVFVVNRPQRWHGTLFLPELPVVSVASVVVDGVALADDAYVLDGKAGTLDLPAPSRWSPPPAWGKSVTVTYTHGFAAIPGDVRLVVLRVAERIFGNPRGKIEEGNDGGYRTKFSRTMAGDAEVPLLSDAEEEILKRYWVPA